MDEDLLFRLGRLIRYNSEYFRVRIRVEQTCSRSVWKPLYFAIRVIRKLFVGRFTECFIQWE